MCTVASGSWGLLGRPVSMGDYVTGMGTTRGGARCRRGLMLPALTASLQRSAAVLEERRAPLWINHDKPQSDRLRYAPAYYE